MAVHKDPNDKRPLKIEPISSTKSIRSRVTTKRVKRLPLNSPHSINSYFNINKCYGINSTCIPSEYTFISIPPSTIKPSTFNFSTCTLASTTHHATPEWASPLQTFKTYLNRLPVSPERKETRYLQLPELNADTSQLNDDNDKASYSNDHLDCDQQFKPPDTNTTTLAPIDSDILRILIQPTPKASMEDINRKYISFPSIDEPYLDDITSIE